MKRVLKYFHNRQKGFTLVEVLVALVIAGVIGVGASSAIASLFGSSSATRSMQAVNILENAIYRMEQDVMMSQSVSPNGNTAFPLTLSWMDWENQQHTVTYSLVSGELRRTQIIAGVSSPVQVVARNITSSGTGCSFENGVLTVNIRAEIDGSDQTRTYLLKNRCDNPY